MRPKKPRPQSALKPQAAPKPKPKQGKPEPIAAAQPDRPGRDPKIDRSITLTRAMAEAIIKDVTEGGYPNQVARQHGIPSSTWYEWLKRGRGGLLANGVKAPQPLIDFIEAVDRAAAQALNVASMEVYKENKLAWLLKGPGRERPGQPGWADRTMPESAEAESKPDNGERAAFMSLFEDIKDRLTDEEMRKMLALGREREAKAD